MKTITAYNGTTKKVTLDTAISDLTGATASDYGFDSQCFQNVIFGFQNINHSSYSSYLSIIFL